MLNLGATADSDNNSDVVGGNICDEADEIVGDTSSSASVRTAWSDTEQYEQKATGSGPAMFSGPINTGSGLTSLTLSWSLIFVNITILEEFARFDDARLFTDFYLSVFFEFASWFVFFVGNTDGM